MKMDEEVKRFIEKAEHALGVAEDLMRSGYPSDAASKIYYSMFYAAQALLKSEGIDVVKTFSGRIRLGILLCETRTN